LHDDEVLPLTQRNHLLIEQLNGVHSAKAMFCEWRMAGESRQIIMDANQQSASNCPTFIKTAMRADYSRLFMN
jgi:hypothetical protein